MQISLANHKSAKFAVLNNSLDLRTFRKFDTVLIYDLWTHSFVICGLKTSANLRINAFSSYNRANSNLPIIKIVKNTTFGTVLRQSCTVFCRNLRICDLRINHKNLRTGTHKKFADFAIAK
jgi:hypothetical protein